MVLVLFATEAALASTSVQTVAVLTPHRDDPAVPIFFGTPRQLGYEEGRNPRLVVRSADWIYDRLPVLAAELVVAGPDVIVAINAPGARAAIRATQQIPIVMA